MNMLVRYSSRCRTKHCTPRVGELSKSVASNPAQAARGHKQKSRHCSKGLVSTQKDLLSPSRAEAQQCPAAQLDKCVHCGMHVVTRVGE